MSTLGAPIKKNPSKNTQKKETPTNQNEQPKEEPKNEEPKKEENNNNNINNNPPTKTTSLGVPTKNTSLGAPTKTTSLGAPIKTTKNTSLGAPSKTTSLGVPPKNTPGTQTTEPQKDEKSTSNEPSSTTEQSTTNEQSENTSGSKDKKKKKKKKTNVEKPEEKDKPEVKDAPEKPEKVDPKAKTVKKNVKKTQKEIIAEKIRKEKEEKERLQREEKERKMQEEEERKREEEEEKKRQEELEKNKEIERKNRDLKKKEEEKKRQEIDRLKKLAKYNIQKPVNPKTSPTEGSSQPKPKKKKDTSRYQQLLEEQRKEKEEEKLREEQRLKEEQQESSSTQSSSNTQSTPTSVEDWEQLVEETPSNNQEASPQSQALDDWEQMLDNEDNLILPSPSTSENSLSTSLTSPSNTINNNNKQNQSQQKDQSTQSPQNQSSHQSPQSSHSEKSKGDEKDSEEDDQDDEDKSSSIPLVKDKSLEGTSELRSPIVCVLGHVDVGKTKILDKIRQTHVQDDEAGGITQQIGATWFPMEALKERVSKVQSRKQVALEVPGLLIIDTPGHESFTNLRSRGSSLCDLAILVVDIMHGIEQQTIESIKLLQMKNTPFVVALNKVDRIYGWNKTEGAAFKNTFKKQPKNTQLEFKNLLNRTILHFAEQSINAKLYSDIKNFKEMSEWVALVPTSAHTGEGIPDLLLLITQYAQIKLKNSIVYEEQFEATILEVKPVEGIGKTIDVIIVNGVLKRGDKVVLCGLNGPIVTHVKAILTPHPLKELRVKNEYVQHEKIKAAQGVKIVATGSDLEKAVPGSPLYVVENEEQLQKATQTVMRDFEKLKSNINKEGQGVYVNSSTLGALEALLHFLKSEKIPVCDFSIGPVHKKDVIKAGTMIERKMKKFAVILAFDVKVNQEAELEAKKLGVTIMTADIIYHLTDQFQLYLKKLEEEDRKQHEGEAVFPCVLEIIPEYIFNKKNPVVVGVKVLEGELRRGTPICIPSKEMIDIGVVTNIQFNNQDKDFGKKGEEVAVSISPHQGGQHYSYDRHFDHQDKLVSKVTRKSIDAMKMFYKEDVSKHLDLFKKLKMLFNID